MNEESKKKSLSDISRELRRVRASDYKMIYINSAGGSVSPWDIRITVGNIVDLGSGEGAIEDSVTLVMSPEHAKAMVKTLSSSVEKYEELFGEIKDILPIIREAKSEKNK